MHSYAPDVTETTCVAILQPGYRIGERTIRPARVAVAEPQPGAQTVKPAEEGAEAKDGSDSADNAGTAAPRRAVARTRAELDMTDEAREEGRRG